MVQTRAATKRIESGTALPQDTAVASSSGSNRRQGGAESPKKRRRGKPGELCQLNLDVLFLLAAYLHPLDLLNLARTCKSLRELLMDKASAFVWKTARSQVDSLPDCPADLTEPEYANLVFYARCHGCGKYAKKILWSIRRRYCPDCRHERLRSLSTCPDFIRNNHVLPIEDFIIDGERTRCVDKEQIDLFICEYDRASSKEQFLSEKRKRYSAICLHARNCKEWEWFVASTHKHNLELRRQERYESIFERLKQHGYEPEIAHFGYYEIQQSHKSFFRTSKPLTDKEWAWMLPEWLETMKNFRSKRIERTVYLPRQELLASEYANYVASRSPNTPDFELLPHVSDVARFPRFREVIHAPEEAGMSAKAFEPAFEHLPTLVDKWKRQLDAEFTELVHIPHHLSSKAASGGDVAPNRETRTESIDALRLACAVFCNRFMGLFVAWYPEVLSSGLLPLHADPVYNAGRSECAMSIRDRCRVTFLEEAPYIVHACGLDPNVAKAEDVDNRNARLTCLSCSNSYVMTWRSALKHAISFHPAEQSSLPESPRWQLVSDEHINAIQAAEWSVDRKFYTRTRCLLCHPSVGDARFREDTFVHLIDRHDMELDAIQEGIHYASVGLHDSHPVLEMVEEGDVVTFKDTNYQLF